MRVECESCRELVVASFGVDGDAVRATCPACHHVMTASAPGDAPGDARLCAKCGAALRGDAIACASCGLEVARMAAYTEASDAAVPAQVRDAWTSATEHWADAAPHDELLRLVAVHNCYAWAARRYRTRGGDPVARRQLERLRRATEATLLAGATARRDAAARPYRSARSVLAILIVAIAVAVVYSAVVRERPRARPTAPARPLTPGQPVSPSTVK